MSSVSDFFSVHSKVVSAFTDYVGCPKSVKYSIGLAPDGALGASLLGFEDVPHGSYLEIKAKTTTQLGDVYSDFKVMSVVNDKTCAIQYYDNVNDRAFLADLPVSFHSLIKSRSVGQDMVEGLRDFHQLLVESISKQLLMSNYWPALHGQDEIYEVGVSPMHDIRTVWAVNKD